MSVRVTTEQADGQSHPAVPEEFEDFFATAG